MLISKVSVGVMPIDRHPEAQVIKGQDKVNTATIKVKVTLSKVGQDTISSTLLEDLITKEVTVKVNGLGIGSNAIIVIGLAMKRGTVGFTSAQSVVV